MNIDIPEKERIALIHPKRTHQRNLTLEENREDEKCTLEEIKQIKSVLDDGYEESKKYATALSKSLKEKLTPDERASLERKTYLLTKGAIIQQPEPKVGKDGKPEVVPNQLLNHLGRKNLLREMTPGQGLALAICSLQLKDPSAFKKLIFNFKTIPLKKDKSNADRANTDLLSAKIVGESTLGHLAARKDIQEAIQYIACNHRNFLEQPDEEGNTLVHTASKHKSWKTITYLMGLSKKLFGRKNLKGETPLDLESGPQICKSIAISIVEQDIKAGEEILKKAVDACETIKKKTPTSAPPPTPNLVPSPKLQMEKVKFG